MTNLFSLLSLPKTSKGFTAVRATAVAVALDDGSLSISRKVPRLDNDSDSATASRPQPKVSGPIKIDIIGSRNDKLAPVDAQLTLLHRCIRIVLTKEYPEVIPTTYETVYNACRSIVVVADKGEGLYDTLKLELEYCTGRLTRILAELDIKGIEWITHFVNICEWFSTQINLLKSLLTYLDQVYVVKTPRTSRIHDLAFFMFNSRIFGNLNIVKRLQAEIESWVNWERSLSLKHELRDQIPLLITQLLAYQQYPLFEEHYINVTQDFYIKESERLSQTMKDDAIGFFRHTRLRLEEEVKRAKMILPVCSWSLVRKTTEQALWTDQVDWLANRCVPTYMGHKDIETLGSMYALFARVQGTKALCATFKSYLQTSVAEIVKDQDREEEMVQRLLELKDLADQTISTVFVDDPEEPMSTSTSEPMTSSVPTPSTSVNPRRVPNKNFVYALSDAFSLGFKARKLAPAEQIAKHLDRAMRKGQGQTSDVEYEAELDRVLALYRFTDDKDVFRTFYHRALAKRLLLGRSASDDFEKGMIRKLKESELLAFALAGGESDSIAEYDPDFGVGDDMFKDLALSREVMREYHDKLPYGSTGRQLGVVVLQRSAWPFTVPKDVIDLPPRMQADLTAFTTYYKARHAQHMLDWDHALGTVSLVARFSPGTKELSVSLYQAVILLLFNETTDISFAEIKAQLRMDDAELRRTLQSLACGKKKVLKKIPAGRDVNDEDMFRYNADFDDPKPKIHINSIQAKVSPEESKRTNITIEGDRKHYLDAAIVRIMKARKELSFEQLKIATIDAVTNHFKPSVEQIKKRIDTLVEMDYLERSPKDKNMFLYLA